MWPPSLSQQYPKFKKNKMTFLETCEVTALGSREKGGNEQACSCVQSVVCLYVMFICGVCCAGCVYVRFARMVCDMCPLVRCTCMVHAACPSVKCVLHTPMGCSLSQHSP